MEIVLLACAWLVYTAGAQSEQAKVGLSPAQRDILREKTRHDRTVQKIARKHGGDAPDSPKAGVSPWKAPSATEPAVTIPEAFQAGYRRHTPIERVATPVGRRAGQWAARGVAWGKDTGRGAVREYRKRRQAAGHGDPAPILVPLPPSRPPDVPPMPAGPPEATPKGVSLARPEQGAEKAPADPVKPTSGEVGGSNASKPSTGPEPGSGGLGDGLAGSGAPDASTDAAKADAQAARKTAPGVGADGEKKDSAAPSGKSETGPAASETEPARPETESAPTEPDPSNGQADPHAGKSLPERPAGAAEAGPSVPESPAGGSEARAAVPESPTDVPEIRGPENKNSEPVEAGEGVGRMAAEVSYESVMDESDELSAMCKEDFATYDRIGDRCEREIGRGDSLIAELQSRGAGQGLLAWIARCKEDYSSIHGQLGSLKQNTLAQGEKVVQAKGLLEAGQGVYARIGQDMEGVLDRDFYLSDAVESDDAAAHTEVYDVRGA